MLMLPGCDCGTCCEQCGHYPDCIRHETGEDDMSYINIHKVDQAAVEGVVDKEPTHSMTDGEEIFAASRLLALLDKLPEGEALVVWRDIF